MVVISQFGRYIRISFYKRQKLQKTARFVTKGPYALICA